MTRQLLQPARPKPVLRNTVTVAAMLGLGLVAGALLAESSLLNFSLSRPTSLMPRLGGYSSQGYVVPAEERGMNRRPMPQPRGIMAHHTGI